MRILRTLCILFVAAAAFGLAGCVTTPENYYPEGREVALEKSDARLLVGEWRGKWLNTKYPRTGDTPIMATFVPLPNEGLYDLGNVMYELVYHNPPGVFNRSDGKTYSRWPQREGYFTTTIVNGGIAAGRFGQFRARETRPGCLMLYLPLSMPGTFTDDGNRLLYWYERCDPEKLEPILGRDSPSPAVATKP